MKEINEVIGFYKSVSLPYTLQKIGFKTIDKDKFMKAAEFIYTDSFIHNTPFKVSGKDIYNCMITANSIGESLKG